MEKNEFLQIDEIDTNIIVEEILDKIKDKDKSLICILGYGNIGKALYDKLKDDYIVIIGIKNNEFFEEIKFKSFYTNDKEYIKKILGFSTIIINTVPFNTIDGKMLDYIEGYFLDIASYPYGINKEYINKINYNSEKSRKILLKK